VITAAGYILGFPHDTPKSICEDIEIIKRELPLDILELMCLTPLPGSEHHKDLWGKGAWLDSDLNKYDLEHVVTNHAHMSRDEWVAAYYAAWDAYYSREHLRTILRRAATVSIDTVWLIELLANFATSVRVENLHPLQRGFWRRKFRTDRRATHGVESVWSFYPKYYWESVVKRVYIALKWIDLCVVALRIKCGPQRTSYVDPALSPVSSEETETLALFTHTADARAAVLHTRKVAKLTNSA
jgi:hypothetical protein